jgi:hypothetical protein
MAEFDTSSAVLDDFDPATAIPEDTFDPAPAVEEDVDPIADPRVRASIFNEFQDSVSGPAVLQGIRADEARQAVPQRIAQLEAERDRATAQRQIAEREEDAAGTGGYGSPSVKYRQEARAIQDQIDELTPSEFGQRTKGTADGNRTPMVARLFGDTIAAQVDKELTQGAKDQAGAVTGGALGARMLMGARAGPIGALLPIAGAITGAMVGGEVQEEAMKALESDEVTQDRLRRREAMQGQPMYRAGGLAAMGTLFRPSLSTIRGAAQGNPEALANIGIGGALGVGTAAIPALQQGRDVTMDEMLEGGALGLAFHQPTRLAQGLFGFKPFELKPIPNAEAVRTPLGTLDAAGNIVEPATSEGIALRATSGLDATTPTEIQPPSRDAQNLLDVIAARHTTEGGQTDWPVVRGVLERMQPSQSTNPEFLGVMDEALRMAEAKAPRTMEQEIAPDLAPEAPTETVPVPPVASEALPVESSIPPEYARAAELPPKRAAEELNIPEPEVLRRRELVKEVNDPKYSTDPLPEAIQRKFREIDRGQAGAAGGTGGSTPKPKPIGTPPSGSTDWLEIAPWWKRGGVSFAREGASPILQTRQKNPIGQALGKATDKQFDVEADLFGRMSKDLSRGTQGMSKGQQDRAMERLSTYLQEKENGRPTPPLTADAQRLLNSWQDVAEFTGLLAQAKNVKVSDGGGYRLMRLIGRDYLPRMINNDVMRAIRDPQRHVTLFNKLVGELAAQRGITPDEAAQFLNGMAGGKSRTGSNDFMGNIEVARQERLPESFYEYDMRRIIPHYVNRYAKRMGQIVAYGQRLGAEGNPVQKNLWDHAMGEVRGGDTTTARWLREAEAQSRNERVLTGAQKLGQRLQTSMTGLLLGNPTSTVPRNLVSGFQTNAELLGYLRTAKAATQALKASNRVPAKELGVIRDDIASMLHADQLPGDSFIDDVIRSGTDKLLKYSGYDASEQWVRSTGTLAASSFARDAAKAITTKPNSAFAKQAQGLIRRMGVDPTTMATEGGNWRTGTETQRFIRAIVNQTQGGYKFNQVPLWAGTPAGRFFYQFGRWGTQRSQNLWENVFKPAFVGDEIKVGGVPMTQRDFKPLMKMGLGTVAIGEAFGALGKVFFDRDRKDYSMTEIAQKMTEDQKLAAKMVASRLINDILMSGSFGIWGQPVDLAVAAKDGSRLKNPAEPPAMGAAKAMMQFGLDAWDQGTVTGDDVKRLTQAMAPGPTAIVDMTRNIFDEAKFEAENDVRTLRNAAVRYGQEIGADVEFKGREASRKNERSPVYTSIRDALLTGDAVSARQIKDDYLGTLKPAQRVEAVRQMKSSVKSRQPFRMGSFYSEEIKGDFLKWARKNLSPEDVEQITRTQARYEQTAKSLGLW